MNTLKLKLHSLAECKFLAERIAGCIHEPVCIALLGTLGAGKTQFTKFFVAAMGGDASSVTSPTFVLVHEYYARLPILHMDLYRLEKEAELDGLGFVDLVHGESVCLIEWANKFASAMPEDCLNVQLESTATNASVDDVLAQERNVTLSASSNTLSAEILKQLAHFYNVDVTTESDAAP